MPVYLGSRYHKVIITFDCCLPAVQSSVSKVTHLVIPIRLPVSQNGSSRLFKMAVGSIYGYKTYSGHLWQIIAQIKSQKVEISVKVLENGGQVAY